ncbi:LLM class flavin-dependent oxidoreductase [Acinetobacter qingfengensis]|uniref:Nitrilotriacetate monooxygenase n=1 Tax=Acinetobacter qingfengensis TaxID=1262585 RepID=A0A1E7R3N2_9GAMM|nr:LLM class flavin-dependent oxidoreductase [Acinetobacter qingfengensis]KAA8735390.1 LLM class flavin-dependent oxidoreductase [Acinetobacter qingfengensis]OEY93904.1 nitrilotriacetate monooxygenase [Acinetobacter qingfengensis]
MSNIKESAKTERTLHFNLFLDGFGHHLASWRHPDSKLNDTAFVRYLNAAKLAEQGKFDAVFFADSLAVDPNVVKSGKVRGHEVEPLTVLSAIAAQTSHIGLIGTATTTYNEPYHIARKFASLDLISNGRAGWNLVTTDLATEAQNFNIEQHVIHKDRYERAEEFYDVVAGLWKSWDQDAIIRDKEKGIFFDLNKLHQLNHKGKYFSVAGPLNVTPSPQGSPIVVQAGSSERGKNLAARTANVIFTAQPNFDSARAFYQDVKNRLKQHHRNENELAVLPGLYVIVAKTQQEAEQKQRILDDLIEEDVGLGLLGRMLGNFDLSKLDVNAALPPLEVTQTGQQSRQELFTKLGREQGWTVKQLYQRVAAGRGHFSLIGTPEYIADQIEYWFKHEAADGFNIMPALIPDGVKDFVELVIPILQQRNLFRTAYTGSTLREHYGIAFH